MTIARIIAAVRCFFGRHESGWHYSMEPARHYVDHRCGHCNAPTKPRLGPLP